MVEVSIQHILGTVALIGLALSAVFAYQMIMSYVETSILKAQLSQVAEYVSMNIASLVSLTEFTYGELATATVTKDLSLPQDLSGKAYTVKIVNEDGGYYVRAEIPTRSDLYAEKPIPMNATAIPIILATDASNLNGVPSDASVEAASQLYGGDASALIWCEKTYVSNREVLYVGLGRRIG